MDQFHAYFVQIMTFIDSLRWYHFLGFFILFVIIFGKKKEWDYEAKLFIDNSNEMSGEFEIEKFSKENPTGKLVLNALSQLPDKETEILINSQLASRFRLEENGTRLQIMFPILPINKSIYRPHNARKWNRIDLPLSTEIKLANNHRVEIKVNGKLFAHGILLED